VKIYTKGGDSGDTSLFGGDRVRKSSYRIEAYGTVDELNSAIGLALTVCQHQDLTGILEDTQHDLFVLGSDLATPLAKKNAAITRISEQEAQKLESVIDEIELKLPPLTSFILPGGSELAARLHMCRTICRRAERAIVELSDNETLNAASVLYINRLSDFLFVLARYANLLEDTADINWKSSRS